MSVKTLAATAGAGAALYLGGLEVMDEAVAWTYGKCLEHGMPYLTNMYFEASLAYTAWFASCVYFTYLDVTRSPTKIQKDYWPTNKEMLECGVPQFFIYGVGCAITWYQWAGDPSLTIDITSTPPTFFELAWQVSISLIVGDFIIYWEHRIMHIIPYLRNNVHNVHHVYSAPFGWAGGWVHPVEDLIVITAQVIPAVIFCHPMSRWVFCILWVVCQIDEHSGHDVWWSPFNWLIPFHGKDSLGGGGDPHDVHHYMPTKNYSFVFCVWDQLFGTYVDPSPKLVNPFKPPFISERRSNEEISELLHKQVIAKKPVVCE
eukprot:TRINITY_DN280_c0_g2_i1.p2 TRINITY_DN280_c0_g2~~TRINITY_DN280_c0_g2_i1.p2  ORF type:complete len:316 (+),score=49.17 TRINITY_DN280_c0_g2_i1:58-1005(+)